MKKLTAADINQALRGFYQNHDYKLENSYIFNWESDFFCIAKGSGYMYETEVKISRSDFKADFTKFHKHELLVRHKETIYIKPSGYVEKKPLKTPDGKWLVDERRMQQYEIVSSGINYVKPQISIPNRFYYACPENLLKKEEMPVYAGLLYLSEGGHVRKIKEAPILHKNNLMMRKRSILMDKFYYQGLEWRHQARTLESANKSLNNEIGRMLEILKKHNIDNYSGEIKK